MLRRRWAGPQAEMWSPRGAATISCLVAGSRCPPEIHTSFPLPSSIARRPADKEVGQLEKPFGEAPLGLWASASTPPGPRMLQLLRLPPQGEAGPAPPVVLSAPPAACTADGRLRLLPDDFAGGSTPAVSSWSSFELVLHTQGDAGPPAPLPVPWGALCPLPSASGLLFAQRGCCRLLFCQHPGALAPGQAVDVFLMGSHEGELATWAVACCRL